MSTRLWFIGLFVGALATVAACGDKEALPTAPTTSVQTADRQPIATAISISGQTSLTRPGESTQLTATARFSDDTTQDVTSRAWWLFEFGDVLTISMPGLFTATRFGLQELRVFYDEASTTVVVRVTPEGTFLVYGSVMTPTGVRLTDTRIVATSSAGALSVMTNQSGKYAVPALGKTTVRIEKEGVPSLPQEAIVSGDTNLDLLLRRADSTGLSGAYSVTFTASGSCHQPLVALQRTYQAVVEELPPSLIVLVLGSDFVSSRGDDVGFTGRRHGDNVAFEISDRNDDAYKLIERIPSVGLLSYSGTATGTISSARIVARFAGTVRLTPVRGDHTTCVADDHGLQLERR